MHIHARASVAEIVDFELGESDPQLRPVARITCSNELLESTVRAVAAKPVQPTIWDSKE